MKHAIFIFNLLSTTFQIQPNSTTLKIKKIFTQTRHGHSPPIIQRSLFFVALCWQRNKSEDTATTSKIDWYFILISAIVGFFVGIILVHGIQRLCRKKTTTRENPQQGTSNPSYNAQADETRPAETIYEELDLKKVEEEKKYQSLQQAS